MGTDGADRVVIVLRHPSRIARLAAALRAADLTPFGLPLTDTELPTDVPAVAAELEAVREGRYAWLVVTSGNAVRALGMIAGRTGTTLADILTAGRPRVAAVGPATAALLAEEGIVVDLVPPRSSSQGLLRAFGKGAGSVLLPQGDLAPEDLSRGLRDLGWSVRRVVAYRTVPYPADVDRAVPALADTGSPPPLLRTADVPALTTAGAQAVVVFLAPSAVRQFRERLGGQVPFLPVAIGSTTAEALRAEGWPPAAVAADPSPEGVVRAVLTALVPPRPARVHASAPTSRSTPASPEPPAHPLDRAPGDRP